MQEPSQGLQPKEMSHRPAYTEQVPAMAVECPLWLLHMSLVPIEQCPDGAGNHLPVMLRARLPQPLWHWGQLRPWRFHSVLWASSSRPSSCIEVSQPSPFAMGSKTHAAIDWPEQHFEGQQVARVLPALTPVCQAPLSLQQC